MFNFAETNKKQNFTKIINKMAIISNQPGGIINNLGVNGQYIGNGIDQTCAPCNVACAPIVSSVGNNVAVNASDFAPQNICKEEFNITVPAGGGDFLMGFASGATTALAVAYANMKLSGANVGQTIVPGAMVWPNKLLLYNDIQIHQNAYVICGYLTFKTTSPIATTPTVTYVYVNPTNSTACTTQELETVCPICFTQNSTTVVTSYDAANVVLSNISGLIVHFDNPGDVAFSVKVDAGIAMYSQPSAFTRCASLGNNIVGGNGVY